ncbi:MAG: GTP 3',8-cyclase MoaA [Thermoanaerobaculia bacterium]
MPLLDRLERPLADLRISVTDRCSFRCPYCMPKEIFGPGFGFLERSQLLSYEEIERLAAAFVRMGVRKIRLTGGEPLLRRDLPVLIARLAALPGLEDLTLTTNGMLLAREAANLMRAGLKRVTVSLDSLDEEVFRRMNDVGASPGPVLAGIEEARRLGLTPIKVNAVVIRGVNDHTLVDLVRFFRGTGVVVRFIEYMDVGNTNSWQPEQVVPAREILEIVGRELPLAPLAANYRGEVARRWRLADGSGEIGIIASVTEPFCGDCSRARLSSEGKVYTCLFASEGHDLRALLRAGASDSELETRLAEIWRARSDRYSEIRFATLAARPKVEMSHIGG